MHTKPSLARRAAPTPLSTDAGAVHSCDGAAQVRATPLASERGGGLTLYGPRRAAESPSDTIVEQHDRRSARPSTQDGVCAPHSP